MAPSTNVPARSNSSAASKSDLKVPKTSLNPSIRTTEILGTKRKIICFSDFDGTISMQDTGHVLFDSHGCGLERREVLDEQIKSGKRSFKEVSEEMWGSLNVGYPYTGGRRMLWHLRVGKDAIMIQAENHRPGFHRVTWSDSRFFHGFFAHLQVPFDNGFEVMKTTLEFDPDFQTFHKFCVSNNIPFNVISAGLKPILRRVLDQFLGEDESAHIDIVANDAQINTPGTEWKPVWLHDCDLGHDKEKSITDYRASARLESEDGTIPLIIFIGDGVSDLPAARQADVLFARKGLRLEQYCIENKIAHIPFDSFADIQIEVQKIMKEDEDKTGGLGLPVRSNPRAHIWRRISSRNSVPLYLAATPRDEKMVLWPEAFTEYQPKEPGVYSTA